MFPRAALLILLFVLISVPLVAQIAPTNETLIYDATGKNMGAIVFGDRLRFRLQDGRNVAVQIVDSPSTPSFDWKREGSVAYLTSDCSGQGYFDASVPPFGDSVVYMIDGRNELLIWDGQPTESHAYLSYLASNGVCTAVNIGGFAYPATVVLDLDAMYTPPFRMGGPTAPAAPSFSDVPQSSPYYQSVESIRSAGITAGCGNGLYCPNAYVTRAQMAAFIAQALGLKFVPAP